MKNERKHTRRAGPKDARNVAAKHIDADTQRDMRGRAAQKGFVGCL